MSDPERRLSPVATHAGMLVLGMVLTVGAYEGTRLVRNTTAALSAASLADTPVEQVAEPATMRAYRSAEAEQAPEPAPRSERRGRKGRKARRAAREAQGLEVRGPRTRPRMERADDLNGFPDGLMLSPKGVLDGRFPTSARLARPEALLLEEPIDEEDGDVVDTGAGMLVDE